MAAVPNSWSMSACPAIVANATASAIFCLRRIVPRLAASSGQARAAAPMLKNSVSAALRFHHVVTRDLRRTVRKVRVVNHGAGRPGASMAGHFRRPVTTCDA
jgi:hypothetical protein